MSSGGSTSGRRADGTATRWAAAGCSPGPTVDVHACGTNDAIDDQGTPQSYDAVPSRITRFGRARVYERAHLVAELSPKGRRIETQDGLEESMRWTHQARGRRVRFGYIRYGYSTAEVSDDAIRFVIRGIRSASAEVGGCSPGRRLRFVPA